MAGAGPVMVEAAPPKIKVENHSYHQALVPSLNSAILTGIQQYSIAVVAAAALIPLLLLQSMGETDQPTAHGWSDTKSKWSMQPRRLRLVAATAFCGTLLLAAGPVAAFSGTVYRTATAGCVHIRECPRLACNSIGCAPEGTNVDISCQARGDIINGDEAWDYISYESATGYASDYYILTPYPDNAPFEPGMPNPSNTCP